MNCGRLQCPAECQKRNNDQDRRSCSGDAPQLAEAVGRRDLQLHRDVGLVVVGCRKADCRTRRPKWRKELSLEVKKRCFGASPPFRRNKKAACQTVAENRR